MFASPESTFPDPVTATVRTSSAANVPVTLSEVLPCVTLQVGTAPVQGPLVQPVKVEPVSADAVRETVVSSGNAPEHAPASWLGSQMMVPSADLISPVPVPSTMTVRTGSDVNVAVTVTAASTLTTQLLVPLHPPPDQPPNVPPAGVEAESVTDVPDGTASTHWVSPTPHEMFPSVDVTVPVPTTSTVSVSVPGASGIASTPASVVPSILASAFASLLPSLRASNRRAGVVVAEDLLRVRPGVALGSAVLERAVAEAPQNGGATERRRGGSEHDHESEPTETHATSPQGAARESDALKQTTRPLPSRHPLNRAPDVVRCRTRARLRYRVGALRVCKSHSLGAGYV